uniref:Putative ribonuclease H-like domain-containing protein n=1 Tax=Tanacetum cinerariifolium TaxID=118510 RepID=A0A6L2NKX2_TANCI|nr:putative ribonuclease H-like domain-containing protein [Tanacetum cinerariifolium]
MVPAALLTQSKPVPITAIRPVSTAVPKISVTRPRLAKSIVTKTNSPPRRNINRSPSLKAINSPPRVTAVKGPMVNVAKGKMSYLSDFEELNSGYVAFGGNPKGGKISGKGKIKTGKLDFNDVYFVKELKFNLFRLPDENQVLLRVPKENNMYNVNLKNIVPSGDLTCLFTKGTIDETNLWHRRMGHINFKTMNKLVKEKAGEEIEQQYVLFPVWSSGSTNPQNTDGDVAFDEKEHEFDEKKPESKVNVSPRSRYRNLSAEFKDLSNNSINEVNVAGTLVPTVGKISPNSTNTFSAAGPLNAASSPTHGKSSFIDASQLPDDPEILELEDLTYSNNEDDVGAAVDFNNLETSITEEGIDYEEVFAPVARIEAIRLCLAYASFIGFMVYQMDVKSAFLYETIEEEVYVCQPPGFEDPDYPDKVYKVVKALYGLHQAPRDLTLQVVLGSMESLQRMVYVINVLSVGYLITPQMVLNSPCLTHIKKWLVQIKWSLTTVAVKKVNDIIRLQALVDKKKVVVTEDTVRDVLRLDDTEGVECLPNEEIFAELAKLGYEKPSIKLTFYKAFFSSQWKKQVGDLTTHTTKYTSPALTQKVFANMRQVAKGDAVEVHGEDVNAGNEAEGDVSAANDELPIADEEPSIPSPTPPTPPP